MIKYKCKLNRNELLALRLNTLYHDFIDDYDTTMNLSSIESFLKYMIQNPDKPIPMITATPDGDVFTEWKYEKDHPFIWFYSDGRIIRKV